MPFQLLQRRWLVEAAEVAVAAFPAGWGLGGGFVAVEECALNAVVRRWVRLMRLGVWSVLHVGTQDLRYCR